ncbi:DUF4892 domain-containing protein [Parendozoicomonas sp. Alg238-R29]|uniref:DUF4892 domain-containing protein n=1 Tax=Parendozoicomonas sp. Alg238-R29 TaxID=2993446 RepID=UPI00248E6C09|nr:DUF4892 domain-containing protein [Parendozoicomonas sp. Alg238-R29]
MVGFLTCLKAVFRTGCIAGVFSLSLSTPLVAEDSDIPHLERYPNASLELSESREARNYPLLSSRVKKIRGDIRAEQEEWRDGQLERRIYEMPSGHSSDRAFNYFSKKIKALGVDIQYVCEGRDCGPSNLWANDIFGVATLYGHDREQRYMLASRKLDGQKEYYVLYTVTRGTRRVYAMIDQFFPVTSTP